jgi:glycine/D-amino acid oxidase-like deaminating enzyme
MNPGTQRIAVVGAGVVGAAVARELAVRGARVWLLDKDDRAEGTTGISFAWLNAHGKREPGYHRLNVAGMAEHAALAARLGSMRRWHFPAGNLEYATDPAHAARMEQDVAELRALGYPAEWVDPGWARGREPSVRIPDDAAAVAFFASEGYVLPRLLNDALIDAARAAGAEAHLDSAVRAIRAEGGHLTVESAARPPLDVDRVVICAGRWSQLVADGLGLPVPLVAADGPDSAATAFQACTVPLPVAVRGVVTTSVGNVRPEPDGRVLFQAPDLDGEADPAAPVPAHVIAEMERRLTRVLRTGRAPVRLESAIVGKRALPQDGYTIAGFLDEAQAVYAVVTHSGITLGPLLGRLAAEEIIDGCPADLLAAFRPGRFAARLRRLPLRDSDAAARAARFVVGHAAARRPGRRRPGRRRR